MKRLRAVTMGILMLVLTVLLFGCLNHLNIAPTAEFVLLTDYPVAGNSTDFDASTSLDPDGKIVSYQWDFDDGSPIVPGEQVSRWYQSAGIFRVQLTVMDSDGATDICFLDVEIASMTGESEVLMKNLDEPGIDYCIGHELGIWLKNVLGPCSIDWGDGQVDVGNFSKHSYYSPGLKDVCVVNARGESVWSNQIYIEACCLEVPQVEVSIPRIFSGALIVEVIARDPDLLYDLGLNVSRPTCQGCGTESVVRESANEYGICLLQATILKRNNDTMVYDKVVRVVRLNLEDPLLDLTLPLGMYRLILLVVDDDQDCENGRQKTIIIEFKVR